MEPARKKHTLIDLATAKPAPRIRTGRPANNEGLDQREKGAIPQVVDTADTKTRGISQVTLTRSFLVNKLNFINFSNRTVRLKFKHTRFDRTIIVKLKPLPCQGARLDLQWSQEDRLVNRLKSFEFDSILIPDDQKLIRAEAKIISMNQTGISLRLPETCHQISNRKMRRYTGRNVDVQMVQNSSLFRGCLLDFNAVTFRVELEAGAHQTFEWINPESSVSVILSGGADTYYSGECKILRHCRCNANMHYVLEPISRAIHRYRHKEFRSERLEINPSPDIYFTHPLSKKPLSLKVVDLSGSGFSVEEDELDAQLLAGLTIPEVDVRFSNNVSVHCKAQVVYRRVCKEGKEGVWVKCGLAIVDMDTENNVKLLSLLHQANNRYSYICNTVDLDALWGFFF